MLHVGPVSSAAILRDLQRLMDQLGELAQKSIKCLSTLYINPFEEDGENSGPDGSPPCSINKDTIQVRTTHWHRGRAPISL